MVNHRVAIQKLKLDGKTQVVVVGGSSGIGRSVAIQYASLGASVVVVGRTPAAGEVAVAEMKKASPSAANARFGFIQVDLSLVQGMRQAAAEIRHWVGEGGVQYLIQTQGVAPIDKPLQTSDGFEVSFATQAISRFAVAYLLFESGALMDDSVIFSIAVAGKGGDYVPKADDVDLGVADKGTRNGVGFVRRNANVCAVIDCFTKELAIRHPSCRFFHTWPATVKTDIIGRSPNAVPILKIATKVLFHFLPPPEHIATVSVYIASGLGKDQTSREICWDEKGRPIPLSAAATDKTVREKVWARLVEIIQA